MYQKFYLFCVITSWILVLIVQGQASGIATICYNSSLEGFRLNTMVLKTKVVSQWIDCVMECASEACCRSINYKNTMSPHNKPNCEMLHDVVYNASKEMLENNSSYDYVYLVNPEKEYNSSCSQNILKKKVTDKWTSAPGSFLFSLRNHDDLPPFKAPLLDENNVAAIYRYGGSGPVFGFDLDISNNARSNAYSYTDFGDVFQPPPGYIYNNTKTQSLLAGSYYFTPAEIEVLHLD